MNQGTNDNETNSRPLLSICIPAFNAQKYMESCLWSLASQTFQNIEVVIVDDGSYDPLSIDERITGRIGAGRVFLERTDNQGVYAARQYAALHAKGDYVFFVDADDELYGIRALAKLADAITIHGSDVILFNAVSESGELLANYDLYGWRGELDPNVFLQEMAMHHRLNSLWCMAFRRELLVADMEVPRLCYAEDRLQKFQIVSHARSVWVINEPLYLYKETPTSTTRARYRPEYYLQACRAEERIVGHFNTLGIDWSAWADGFMRTTCGHLLSVLRESGMVRRERLDTYELFRKQLACKLALIHLDRRRIGTSLYLWIGPFERRHFSVLDFVLVARGLIWK